MWVRSLFAVKINLIWWNKVAWMGADNFPGMVVCDWQNIRTLCSRPIYRHILPTSQCLFARYRFIFSLPLPREDLACEFLLSAVKLFHCLLGRNWFLSPLRYHQVCWFAHQFSNHWKWIQSYGETGSEREEPHSKQPKVIPVFSPFRFKNYPKQLTETTFSDFYC